MAATALADYLSLPFPAMEILPVAAASTSTNAPTASSDPPKRISFSEMDTGKFAMFGSFMIVGLETAMFPLNTIQCIVMSQRTKGRPKSLWKTVKHTVRNEGVLRLWRGIVPQTIGALPGQASYYVAYETMHELVGAQFPQMGESSFVRGFISGACADVAGGLFYVPADIIAQRLQTQNVNSTSFTHNKRLYNGGADVARKILQQEGILGFWRGYVGYVTAFAPASAVQWGVYELCKMALYPFMAKLDVKNSESLVVPLSGGIAGFCALCANNPLEVMRIRLQLLECRNKNDAEIIRKGYWHLGFQIFKHEGPRAFYRGLTARLLTTLPGVILAMTGYEYIKDLAS
ncbi:mitochondrial carrier domain-containing protein [Chytriomyces cf. hyalinus JEL632]|nr:mitochondrial carrier domain-containing protein [Chytriomyces cf. hyalinus JEL632]